MVRFQKALLRRKGSPMAQPLSNRALADDVFRLGPNVHLSLIGAKDNKALVASLVLRHGNIELDRLTRTCRLNGRPCPLTGHEYGLLSFLLLHRGQVWSRKELIKRIWQRDRSSINLVATYINKLRIKLGPGILCTVRGQGYTIDAENSGRQRGSPKLRPAFKSRG
jgi:DNA-binding response OmpR family regulator